MDLVATDVNVIAVFKHQNPELRASVWSCVITYLLF